VGGGGEDCIEGMAEDLVVALRELRNRPACVERWARTHYLTSCPAFLGQVHHAGAHHTKRGVAALIPSQPKEQSTMTLFRARSRRASS
jgi:hypothetical protein